MDFLPVDMPSPAHGMRTGLIRIQYEVHHPGRKRKLQMSAVDHDTVPATNEESPPPHH